MTRTDSSVHTNRRMSLIRIVSAVALVCALAGLMISRARATVSPQAAQIVHDMEARYHGAKTLKAIFLERYSEGRTTARVESGTAYFSRPGRMRWEYEEPEKKLFLSDGRTV